MVSYRLLLLIFGYFFMPVTSQETICPDLWMPLNGLCFRLFEEKKTWPDAKAFCESEDASLVSVPDRETNTFLLDMIDGQSM